MPQYKAIYSLKVSRTAIDLFLTERDLMIKKGLKPLKDKLGHKINMVA